MLRVRLGSPWRALHSDPKRSNGSCRKSLSIRWSSVRVTRGPHPRPHPVSALRFELRLVGVPLCPAWLSLLMRRGEPDGKISFNHHNEGIHMSEQNPHKDSPWHPSGPLRVCFRT